MNNGYISVMKVTDYGPYITKLILPVADRVKAQQLKADCFSVYAERLDDRGQLLHLPKTWMDVETEANCGYMSIKAIYPSDEKGEPCDEGSYITLDLPYGPSEKLNSCVCPPDGYNIYIHNRFVITQTVEIASETEKLTGMLFDMCLKRIQPDLDGWLHGETVHPTMPIRYGFYVPQHSKQGKKPLIVWLHGAGEGGFDTWIPFTANKVVAFATPETQSCFDGSYIFVPQCETFWMNDGSGEYDTTGKSMYSEALFAAISYFVERHTDIDKDRIYIGGDSNGGFMTMRMILDHPTYFAAAFPVCEALYDESITDQEIQEVKHLPIWLTHAKNDPIVKPELTVVPTYKRMKEAGVPVHFSFWDDVKDIHEGFKDVEGNPYEYNGHFSWIPLFNNDCNFDYDDKPVMIDGKPVTVLQWLAKQHK